MHVESTISEIRIDEPTTRYMPTHKLELVAKGTYEEIEWLKNKIYKVGKPQKESVNAYDTAAVRKILDAK